MIREGFKKVYQTSDNGGIILAEFFNPSTGEEYSAPILYEDGSFDEIAYLEDIDEIARKRWRSKRRDFRIGDIVRVVRGIKAPLGTVGKIVDMYDWRDEKGRIKNRYVVLDNGMRTSNKNVIIV